MSHPTKIAVLTGTRADYGLLRELMKLLNSDPAFELETIVTGTHFAPEFGNTWEAIIEDGLPVTHRVYILPTEDSPLAIAESAGEALGKIAGVLDVSRPELLIVLGDRFEAHAAVEAAFLLGIPVAHIAGGEKTEGALDDALRHSMTKFSSLHFVAADQYAGRVKQLGERPDRVHNVGAIGLDNFEQVERMNALELSAYIGFDLVHKPFFLCTLHPETATEQEVEAFFAPLKEALSAFPEILILFTRANADAGGRRLNDLLAEFESEEPDRIKVVASLGQRGYISAMELARVVIGNSSSGILEAPTAGTPTVNIGSRQKGRLRAPSVIDVGNEPQLIELAIHQALSKDMQGISVLKLSPFGAPGASRKIVEVIRNTNLNRLLPKKFIDLETGEHS